MQFLEIPHVPSGDVALCAIGSGNPDVVRALRERAIEVVELGANPLIPGPWASHADMLLHDLGQGRLVIASCCGNREQLAQLGFAVEEIAVAGMYPHDVALNCFCLNGVLYGHSDAVNPELLNYYQSRKRVEVAHVRQGYTKCSVTIVDACSIITADTGIAAAAEARGLNVLRIRPGFIGLPGCDTGFIGGCCGLLSKNILAFCGSLQEHPDGESIENFCNKRGIKTHCLTKGSLRDIGGILPLTVRA